MIITTKYKTINAVVLMGIVALWLGMNSPQSGTYYSPLSCTEFENPWSFASLPTVSVKGYYISIFINTHVIWPIHAECYVSFLLIRDVEFYFAELILKPINCVTALIINYTPKC
jgi:hypothetical protein